jgi:hypothetical protein
MVTVTILDSDGATVRKYDLKLLKSGPQEVVWDVKNGIGEAVPPEAYSWRIEAKTSSGKDAWEPAGLYSRPIEYIDSYKWEETTRTLSYRLSVPMRIWVRIGIDMGACLRTLAEGTPRPRDVIVESWDGADETGTVNVLEQPHWGVAIFGYRLPQPSVIVSGRGAPPRPSPSRTSFSLLNPPISLSDPPWERRRGFVLAERLRPDLQIEQLGPDTFAAHLEVPADIRDRALISLQSTLAHRVRLKWFVDGHCASEDVDAFLPSMLTLQPGQLPATGKHFITANLLTALDSIFVASRWIE